MADHSEENTDARVAGKMNAARPSWMRGLGERMGVVSPRSFKVKNTEYGSTTPDGSPSLQSLGFEDLIGASPQESANIKANHTEPGVFTGMIAETMAEIEKKYHSGQFDAAAEPLVEQYIEEIKRFADIQTERMSLVSLRVADIKQANDAACQAVSEERTKRETEIREHIEFRRRIREIRDLQRMFKQIDTDEASDAKRRIEDESRASELAHRAMRTAAESRTRLADEELRRAEKEELASESHLKGAQAAARAAEENLGRARTEFMETELRLKQKTTLREMRESLEETHRDLDEAMSRMRGDVEDFCNVMRKEVNEMQEKIPASELPDEPDKEA